MIRGIHYFSTELKTKIDVIPRGYFNIFFHLFWNFRTYKFPELKNWELEAPGTWELV